MTKLIEDLVPVLSESIHGEEEWLMAFTATTNTLVDCFYELGKSRDYDATTCRRHMSMVLLYNLCSLVVEEGVDKEMFLTLCGTGYEASVSQASEKFKTAGNA